MAPEQWHAAAAGPGADLYAAGCILFEMLTGQVPFTGPSLPALMAAHLTKEPVPPRDLKPGVPAALNDLVLSLLAKEPASRPASSAELLASLACLRDTPRRVQEPSRMPVMPLPPGPRDAPLPVPEPANAPRIGLPSRLMCTLIGHTRAVYAVAFSPDGKLLATASVDETARLWDATTGQTVRALTSRSGFVRAVAFSPNGQLLATACHDKTAQLWDIASGKAIRTLTGHAHSVNAVAFSPDGRLLATACHDKTARLWASG
jgi:WD40 repeat protein